MLAPAPEPAALALLGDDDPTLNVADNWPGPASDESRRHHARADDPGGQCVCAGVIPFCIHRSKLYFVLGKSRAGGRFGSFTGKGTPGESPERTAAREFTEETLGVILSETEMLDRLRRTSAERVIHSRTPTGKSCVTFLVEVPYSPTYGETFRRVRGLLESQQLLPYNLAEMADLRLIQAEYMTTVVKRTWQHSGLIRSEDSWAKIEAIAARWQPSAARAGAPHAPFLDPLAAHDDGPRADSPCATPLQHLHEQQLLGRYNHDGGSGGFASAAPSLLARLRRRPIAALDDQHTPPTNCAADSPAAEGVGRNGGDMNVWADTVAAVLPMRI